MAYKNPPKEHEFQPGKSGNEKGKPKGTISFKTRIKKWLEVEMEDENPETGKREKMALIDILILAQIKKAKRGNDRSFELIKNHIESLPKQGIDLSNTDGTLSKEIVFRDYTETKDKKKKE